MSKKKRILSLDDLYSFYFSQNKTCTFSSKDSGYQLAVQIPATFEVDESVDENHCGMMKLKFRIFHTGINRNNSRVSKESAERAMSTIPDRPVLAAIHQLNSGEWDFHSHDVRLVEDEDGNEHFEYIESQVGSFSSEPAFWEHDDKLNKDYVCAYAYISREYTKACEIIERKGWTKNSCELFINELGYDAKEKCLDLIDFYVNASTLLGSEKDGTEIGEGMEGSRADIAEFSVGQNAVKYSTDEKLVEVLEKLNATLSNFDINNHERKEENTEVDENEVVKNEETVEETVEVTDGSETTEETGESTEVGEHSEADVVNGEGSDEGSGDDSGEEDSESGQFSITINNGKRTFEISLQDKIYALDDLVNATYAEQDNTYYSVTAYETYVVMHDWWNGRFFKQSYSEENDVYTLTGDRVEVFAEFVTADELAKLDDMRANYSAIESELQKYKDAESFADKMTVFEDSAYAEYLDTDEFKSLMSKETVSKYSKEELVEKADATLGKIVKKTGTFSANPEKGKSKKLSFGEVKKPKTSKYSTLFN